MNIIRHLCYDKINSSDSLVELIVSKKMNQWFESPHVDVTSCS